MSRLTMCPDADTRTAAAFEMKTPEYDSRGGSSQEGDDQWKLDLNRRDLYHCWPALFSADASPSVIE